MSKHLLTVCFGKIWIFLQKTETEVGSGDTLHHPTTVNKLQPVTQAAVKSVLMCSHGNAF